MRIEKRSIETSEKKRTGISLLDEVLKGNGPDLSDCPFDDEDNDLFLEDIVEVDEFGIRFENGEGVPTPEFWDAWNSNRKSELRKKYTLYKTQMTLNRFGSKWRVRKK